MALEQDVQKAVDALVLRLREGMESDIRGLVHELMARAGAERQKLLEEARRAADSERVAAVASAGAEAREKADAEAGARIAAEVARLGKEHQAAMAALRQESQASLARACEEAAAERTGAVDEAVSKVRAEAEQVLASSLAETQAAVEEKATVDARASAEQALSREFDQAREETKKGQQAAVAAVSRLLHSVRRLDAQTTLTATLDTLTEMVAAEAGRVAVFVASDGKMRGWRFAGFGTEIGDAKRRVLNGADAGFLSQAIGQRQTRVLRAGAARAASDRPPGFAELPADRSALAVPVLVGGEPIVLVYADDVNAERRAILPQWCDAVELLARHACHRLEGMTANLAAALARGVVPPGLGAPVGSSNVGSGSGTGGGLGESEDEEAARRYARLLVSEIKLYNEGAVTEGRAERDLGFRLKSEIDRAQALYEERIPDTVRSRRLFFDQELVRTLADGNPSLLGT